jgi:dTDP-4-amino-4,6-dideoxygalactose transaminase
MKFKIGFEKEDKKTLYKFWDEIIDSQRWSEGPFTEKFEEKWSKYNSLPSTTFSSWGGAALAALEFFNITDKTVLCPSNTFMATPLAAIKLGNNVEFVDCNKNDLCLSFSDLRKKIDLYKPAAVWIVHIGGHIAFEIDQIAKLCKDKGIILLEDCAHAHGASWNGMRPGSWGDVGIYSFYATKTISVGEGGILVSKHKDLIEFSKKYRNYGKFDYQVEGLNYRMNEFSAAIGCVQTERLDDIVAWKNEYADKQLNQKYTNRLILPDNMISGLYKYIVFDEIEYSTGKVYEEQCHKTLSKSYKLSNSEWISKNHWCVPIYYKGLD